MNRINGLPAHILLVHLVVVLVPVAALVLAAQAWSPSVRRWAGIAGPLLAAAALVAVPLTTQAGEWLQHRLRPTPLIDEHVEMGEQLLPWVIAVFVLSVALWLLARRSQPLHRGLRFALAVVATVAALGAVVQTVRIGDSGAQAVWQGSVASP